MCSCWFSPCFAERLPEYVNLGIVHTLEYKETQQDWCIYKFNNSSVNLIPPLL